MRYCPRCDTEYRDDVAVCSEDGTPLLGKKQHDAAVLRRDSRESKRRHFRLTAVAAVSDQFEAEQLAEALLGEGLDVSLVSSKQHMMGDATSPGPQVYSLVVPENEAERARALLAEWRKGLESTEGEAAAAAEREEAASETESPHS